MKKLILLAITIASLTSCEKETITTNSNPPAVAGYSKKEVLQYFHRVCGNSGAFQVGGDFRWIKDYPFDPEQGVKYFFVSVDSTATGYLIDIFPPLGPSPYVRQEPVLVSTAGEVNEFSLGFEWYTDEGDFYRTTEVRIFKNEDGFASCDIEQKLIKKNGPNEMGEQLKKLFTFWGY